MVNTAMRACCLILALVPLAASAQGDLATAYRVPFASAGNTVELAVAIPAGASGHEAITVTVAQAPPWLRFAPETIVLESLAPGDEGLVAFSFDVDPSAPIGEPAAVHFSILSATGMGWTGTVRLEVEAPLEFALLAAYPNPFNPTLTVPFTLPEAARVAVTVYDVLGRRVAVLANRLYETGQHTVTLDGAQLASGAYLVRAAMHPEAGDAQVFTQRVTLLK